VRKQKEEKRRIEQSEEKGCEIWGKARTNSILTMGIKHCRTIEERVKEEKSYTSLSASAGRGDEKGVHTRSAASSPDGPSRQKGNSRMIPGKGETLGDVGSGEKKGGNVR
jgi:hypothetical protein